MISLKKAIQYHDALIEEFGGSKGIRDIAGLEAALARPYATFDQQELYTSTIDKDAAILESIIINHPFVDGNKRIAYMLMQIVLLEGGLYLSVSQKAQYDFVIAASTGEIRFDAIKQWLDTNTTTP